MFDDVISFIREVFDTDAFIPLHEPRFLGREKEYLNECIDSTFVSSVGKFVDQFEQRMAEQVGSKRAIATMNGTAALHLSMVAVGVIRDELVLTQPFTFVATCNAIHYTGATPVFVDIDQSLGMDPDALERWLKENCEVRQGGCYHRGNGKRIAACVPMHTFGHACSIDRIAAICAAFEIPLVEDSAESLGTTYKEQHTGLFGRVGAFSFNGNKTITCGGGGCIVTDDDALADHLKHLSTTAKVPHKWEYRHDHIGYNYRLPNLNAALACAQMEMLDRFVANKRELASLYRDFFAGKGIDFVVEPAASKSNYWLNAVLLKDRDERDRFLTETNAAGVMTRPAWTLMHRMDMFAACERGPLPVAEGIEGRLVNIPQQRAPKGITGMTQKEIQQLCIDSQETILHAIQQMDETDAKLLIVTKEDKYHSLVSLGDIQRAIIRNLPLDSLVRDVLRKEVLVASVHDSFQQIRQSVLKHRAEYMPVVDDHNNIAEVHFWEEIIGGDVPVKERLDVPVVIMAGGVGSRLKPLTNVIPKALVPIGEKPILEHIVDRFHELGVKQFYLTLNHKSEMIKQYFADLGPKDYTLEYAKEDKPLGTAGSLHLLKDKIRSTFFVSNCDILIDEDYGEIYRYHRANSNQLTIVAALKHYAIPYGTLDTKEGGILEALREKPELTFMVNSGMYILEPSLLEMIPENTFYHITHLIGQVKDAGGRVGVFPVSEGSWLDIGNWSEYNKAQEVFKQKYGS